MVVPGWECARPGDQAGPWIEALEPLTTGLLAQNDLKLWHSAGQVALGMRAGGVIYPVVTGSPTLDQIHGARVILARITGGWCLMGPTPWVAQAEPWLPPSRVHQRVEYDFLARPCQPIASEEGPGVVGPGRDNEAFFSLQEAYEKEEVLFHPSEFQPMASRLSFRRALKTQEIMGLWDSGVPVAKAGTNALTERWAQLGGVYTKPESRGRGLQRRLMKHLILHLANQGRGACLFVKKSNQVASRLYEGLGFSRLTDFTIVYGERRAWVPGFP